MKAIGVIPARYASTRFPGKPLKPILGKALLAWVIEGAKTSRKLQDLFVATDDQRIAKLAESCGVKAVMTDSALPTGSDRVWQAVQRENFDVVINIQGDEPLITGVLLDQLVTPFEKDPSTDMATLGRSMSYADLMSEQTAKIVMNHNDEALYFSRLAIPYTREKANNQTKITACLKHIGMYAYKKDFLRRYCQQAPCEIEKAESLEQLRALYLGAKIKVVRVEHDSWGVDTPEDVSKIEKILSERNHRS